MNIKSPKNKVKKGEYALLIKLETIVQQRSEVKGSLNVEQVYKQWKS